MLKFRTSLGTRIVDGEAFVTQVTMSGSFS
jgi:hypothetical protein